MAKTMKITRKYALHPMVAALAPVLTGLMLTMHAHAADSTNQAKGNTATSQSQNVLSDPQQGRQSNMTDARASRLIGAEVYGSGGERVGEIEDLIIDTANERVHYAVLAHGGFLGLGEKLFAYPISAFGPLTNDNRLTLNVDRDKLANARGFDRNSWPNWGDAGFRRSMDAYEGTAKQIVRPDQNSNFIRASELIGMDVNDRANQDIGEIEDIVVNLNNGRLHYALVEFDRGFMNDSKLFVVPVQTLLPVAGRDEIRMNVDRQQLAKAPGIAENDLWKLNDAKWVTDVDRYLVAIIPMPSTHNDALFGRLDANKDGALSSQEARTDAGINKQWKQLDSNNDGRITRAEFDSRYAPAQSGATGGQARPGAQSDSGMNRAAQ